MKEVMKVHFKSVEDFKKRIASLWQDQKDNEEYEFSFESEEVENAFNELVDCFIERRQQGARL